MRPWIVLLILAATPSVAAEGFTTTGWRAQCWRDGSGSGIRWCRAYAEIVVRHQGERFRGTMQVRREGGEAPDFLISGDRALHGVALAVDGGALMRCTEAFDCGLGEIDGVAFDRQARAGQTLVLTLRPYGMPATVITIELDSYRRAVGELKTMGW